MSAAPIPDACEFCGAEVERQGVGKPPRWCSVACQSRHKSLTTAPSRQLRNRVRASYRKAGDLEAVATEHDITPGRAATFVEDLLGPTQRAPRCRCEIPKLHVDLDGSPRCLDCGRAPAREGAPV